MISPITIVYVSQRNDNEKVIRSNKQNKTHTANPSPSLTDGKKKSIWVLGHIMFAGCSCFEVDAFLKHYYACCILIGFCWRSRWAPTVHGSRSAVGLSTAPVPSWHFFFHLLGVGYNGWLTGIIHSSKSFSLSRLWQGAFALISWLRLIPSARWMCQEQELHQDIKSPLSSFYLGLCVRFGLQPEYLFLGYPHPGKISFAFGVLLLWACLALIALYH